MMLSTYKVVLRNKNNELTSLDPPCESLRVVYPAQDWARAPVGGLLCFDTTFSAYAAYFHPILRYMPGSVEIWEAWGKEPVELPKLRLHVFPLDEGDSIEEYAKRMWSGPLDKNDPVMKFTAWWPNGTLAFRSVNLRYPVLTESCLSDPQELIGRAYGLAVRALRETVSNPWRQKVMWSPLGFDTHESFLSAYERAGTITVGQAYRIVAYGIELLMPKLVEPLFYELLAYKTKKG